MYDLMDHPVSEVREGAMLGFIAVIDDYHDDNYNDDAALKKPWVAIPLMSRVEVLLQKLFTRLAVEREPPVTKLLFDIIIAMISASPLNDFSSSLQSYVQHHGIGILTDLIEASIDRAPSPQGTSTVIDIFTSNWLVLKSKPSVYCSIQVSLLNNSLSVSLVCDLVLTIVLMICRY